MSNNARKRISEHRPTLTLGALATAVALNGCSPGVNVANYHSVGECAMDGNPVAECQQAFDQAQGVAVKVAPRYETRNDCESDYGKGNCDEDQGQQTTGHAPVYVYGSGGHPYGYYYPHANGFAYAPSSALRDSSPEAREAARSVTPQPVFKSQTAGSHLANGESVSPGRQVVAPESMAVRAPAGKFSAGTSVSKGFSFSGGRAAMGSFGRGMSVGG